jgi:ubiquinone biosynthesis protein COQ4
MRPPAPAIPPVPQGYGRLRWARAFRSLRALLTDPDDTAKAIEVNLSIGARDFERSFQRFAATPEGRALLAERPSLAAVLSDHASLAQMDPESLGRAYLAYLERTGFTTTGLLELQDATQSRWEREQGFPPLDAIRAWYRDRWLLVHDLSHIVTGYDTDDLGEAALLAFMQPQIGGRANALLTAGATFELFRVLGPSWLVYQLRAWQRGRSAVPLVALPWEELLPLRVATVRRVARVGEPEETHRQGILTGRRVAERGYTFR